MAATRTILKFHARLHGSEVIALNDADAYATSGAYFCVNSRTSRRAQIMEFSSRHRRGNNDKGKKRRRVRSISIMRHRCQSHVVCDASSLSPRRHLDRRQKTERSSTNNSLAWLTRAILMRRIVWSLDSRTLPSKRFCFVSSVSFIPCRSLCIHASIARLTLPSQVVFPKNDEPAVREC